jgi:dynein assembly factor 5
MLYKFAPSLLPILRSTLQDDDGTTRELATAVLAKIFTLLPNSLGEEAVHQFYPDLLRGLDDSDERVRFVTCEVIIAFLGSSPLNYLKGEILENIADGLFLHLDDPNPLFQEKVLEVISAASKIDLHAIKRIARKSSSTSSRCGMLFLG